MPEPRLQGKTAVITGGASGFGKGIAEKFIAEGARVLIVDLNAQLGESTAASLQCAFLAADITQRAAWQSILSRCCTTELAGGLDIVVNNAGASYVNKATEEVSDDEFDLVMNVNVRSFYMSASVLLPYFLGESGKEGGRRKGVFVQVASTAGGRPRGRLTWYNASKAAVINATKSMAVEYGPQQIRFNCVSPVVGSTGMTHLFIGKPDTPENRKAFESVIPLGRGSTPADVANAACYLASDEASFITGVNIEVDGGRCV